MSKNNIVCLTGHTSELQFQLAELLDIGYEILDIHSQFTVNEKGYDRAKSIIWLQKKVKVSHD